jgi:hypothetical protein
MICIARRFCTGPSEQKYSISYRNYVILVRTSSLLLSLNSHHNRVAITGYIKPSGRRVF